jgi:hypothetical protein
MRGNYHTSHEERRRFFYELEKLCKDNTVEVDLTDTQLCLRDCLFLLDELGFVSSDWEVDAGEGEVWITCYQEDMTYITLLSDAYLGRLQMFWTPGPTQEDIDKLKELMRKHWGKYFPVI